MVLPKWPSRLEPAEYDPPTVDPVQNPVERADIRASMVRLGAILLLIALLSVLWWVGIPTESDLK